MAKINVEDSITNEQIKIYAVGAKYKEKPFYCTGVTDDKTKVILTGQEGLSQSEINKQNAVFQIDVNEHYMIRNNDTINLQKKGDVYVINKDYILYNFYKTQPNIAHSLSEVVKGTHDFYMQNFEAEATKKIKLSKSKAKAGGKVADMSLAEMLNLLYFFGENASQLTSNIAESRVYEKAELEPDKVLAYFEDFDNNQKIVFIKKLLSKGFIKRAEASNYIMYNKITLGANEEEAAAFLYNNANENIYLPLKDMLDKSK
jgi:hypothetical protein